MEGRGLRSRSRRDGTIPGFRGLVITADDPAYQETRAIWNGQIDREPAIIAVCVDAADVAVALRFARSAGMPVAVRGGGHNVAGHSLCRDGLVIDLSSMRSVTLDRGTDRVLVEGGARLGDVDRVTVPAGRLVPSGIVTDTGVGGLALGGGVGWVMRRHGLTCDSIEAVDMVTADCSVRTVDDRNDPELLWGLRGGGGNFGVVTRFHFRTQRFDPTVLAGFVVYSLRDPDVLRGLAAYADDAPRDVTTITFLRLAPPLPWMPAAVVGTPVIMIGLVHVGAAASALRAVTPLRHLGTPLVDTIRPRAFLEHQAVIDAANPSGHRYHWSSQYVGEPDQSLLDLLVEHAADLSAPGSLIALFQLGGAIPEAADRSCAAYRSASFLVTYGSHWLDPAEDDRHRAWTRAAMREVARHGLGGGYTNFDGDQNASAALTFPPASYRRLVALKRAHDPDNVFRHNVNIPPDAAAG